MSIAGSTTALYRDGVRRGNRLLGIAGDDTAARGLDGRTEGGA
jgi:hypothetical protein